MSYFYGNSLHINVEEEGNKTRSVCSEFYPPAMIPSRNEDHVGQYPCNGYTTPNVSYTLVPQSYMWASDHNFAIQNHEQHVSRVPEEPGSGLYPRNENIDPDIRSRKRRLPTVAQRRAANVRERRRMFNLNEAFDLLRRRVPTFAYEKRLSRIETLRLAISYIGFMTDIVNGKNPEDVKFRVYKNHTGHNMSRRQANGTVGFDENDSNGDSSLGDCPNDQELDSEYESTGDD